MKWSAFIHTYLVKLITYVDDQRKLQFLLTPIFQLDVNE